MADTKISNEAAAATLTGAELVLAVQSSANVRTTAAAIAGVIVSRTRVPLTEGAAPSAVSNEVQLYAATAGGRGEPNAMLEDSVAIPLSRTPRRSVSASDSFAARDEIVWVTANTIDMTLPSPTNHDGRQYLVIKSHAGANAITLVRTGSESINGTASSFVLTGSGSAARGEWHITTDGTNWIVSGGTI
jgi:hypothetical protein